MKQFVIEVRTSKGEKVKVFGKQSLYTCGVFKFDFYVPVKYELSYIRGNYVYKNVNGSLVFAGKFYNTARVLGVWSLGRNIKNKDGEFKKYIPHVTNCVVIEAMPSEVMNMDIDNPMIAPIKDVAARLFDTFCKIK